MLRVLSFEIVSYFDIRISNLVTAKGCAVPFVVKLFLVAAFHVFLSFLCFLCLFVANYVFCAFLRLIPVQKIN